MFIEALLTKAKDRNNPDVHQLIKGKQNAVYTYNEILISLKKEGNSAWMNLEDIMPSEISQTQKYKHDSTYMKHLE